MMPASDARADGVVAQAGTDLALLHDLERDRQRAGLEGERQVLGLLERPPRERDLAVARDPALDHRRPALDPAVEQDRHVVADVPPGLVPELAAAGAIELEGDDRPVGQRVDLGLGVLEVAAGDDGPVLERVEEPVRTPPPRWSASADQRRVTPRGSWRATVGMFSRLSTRGNAVSGTMYSPGVPPAAGWIRPARTPPVALAAAAVSAAAVSPPAASLVRCHRQRSCSARVTAQQLLHRRGLAGRGLLAVDAHLRSTRSMPGIAFSRALVSSVILNSRKALRCTMRLGPRRVVDAGQLHHDPLVAHLLDHRLGDAELVDALPEHGEREIEVVRSDRRRPAWTGRAPGRGASRPGGRGRA